MRLLFRLATIIAGCTFVLTCSGCKSYWISAEIENQTGQTIHEIEVAYPTASFGNNALANGASMHYRFQIRGSGPVKVEYTFANGKVTHAEGLNLVERQQGELQIRLLPDGKVEFLPKLNPAP